MSAAEGREPRSWREERERERARVSMCSTQGIIQDKHFPKITDWENERG